MSITLRSGRVLALGERTLVMGVVNVTPDSFYPGSRVPRPEDAIARALAMADEGADILDIGGESTRPGSDEVASEDETARVLPVIEGIRKQSGIALSVDTRKAEVARLSLDAGADIINDVSGLAFDPAMTQVAAQSGAHVVIMHARGTPVDMQDRASYEDLLLEIKAEIGARIAAVTRAGVRHDRIWIDPGLGFAKTARHNLEILARLRELAVFERPLVVGPSRKSFLGRLLGGAEPADRLEASLAAATIAALNGAHILRVHDVAATRVALRVADAVRDPERSGV